MHNSTVLIPIKINQLENQIKLVFWICPAKQFDKEKLSSSQFILLKDHVSLVISLKKERSALRDGNLHAAFHNVHYLSCIYLRAFQLVFIYDRYIFLFNQKFLSTAAITDILISLFL